MQTLMQVIAVVVNPHAIVIAHQTLQFSKAAGTETTNIATVTLSVTAVNESSVTADVLLTTLEDIAVAIKITITDVDKAATNDHVQNLIGNNGIDAHVASGETSAAIVPSKSCIAVSSIRFAAFWLIADALMLATFHKHPSSHPDVGQRKQRDQLRRVLLQPLITHLDVAELALDYPKRMLHPWHGYWP